LDYDSTSGSLVLFGGSACGYAAGTWSCPTLGDTWAFQNGSWALQTPTVAPPPRELAAMAYDPQLNGSLLVGGESGGAYYDDAWTYGNDSWSSLVSPLAPAPREGAEMVYDAAQHTMVLFGGYVHVGRPSAGAELYYNDTWTFTLGAPPSGFSVVSMALSGRPAPVNGLVLIVGDIRSATMVGYSFTGLPPGCVALDTNLLVCTPTATGSFTVVLTVTNALGETSTGSILLYVDAAPTVLGPSSPLGVSLVSLFGSGAAGVVIGVVLIGTVSYVRGRARQRERAEGEAIARELENPTPPDRPTP
jgi:hypothetical protein